MSRKIKIYYYYNPSILFCQFNVQFKYLIIFCIFVIWYLSDGVTNVPHSLSRDSSVSAINKPADKDVKELTTVDQTDVIDGEQSSLIKQGHLLDTIYSQISINTVAYNAICSNIMPSKQLL